MKAIWLTLLLLVGCDAVAPRIDPPLYEFDTPAETWMRAQIFLMNNGGGLYIVSNTGSMEPLLIENDLLIVQPEPYEDLRVGKVVTYRATWRDDTPVTHRLVKKSGNQWALAGDANTGSDPYWMNEDEYMGTVVRIYRKRRE